MAEPSAEPVQPIGHWALLPCGAMKQQMFTPATSDGSHTEPAVGCDTLDIQCDWELSGFDGWLNVKWGFKPNRQNTHPPDTVAR